MKHFFVKGIFLSFLTVAALAVQGQSADKEKKNIDKEKKTTIRVRVSEDENGKGKDIEKEYQVKSMTDEERKEFIDKVLDSLGTDSKGRTVSVTVDDGDGDDRTVIKKRKKVTIDHPEDKDAYAFHWKNDFPDNFEFDSEKFRSHMRNFEREFRPKAKIMMRDMENFGDRMGDFWNKEIMKPSSVRDMNVYSNNPDNGVLNLRFHVQEKGDLTITVTDIKGREVGKREIKDFSGDFVGQIDLKKNTKGTVFVTVVQNEDGAVKRVVIP